VKSYVLSIVLFFQVSALAYEFDPSLPKAVANQMSQDLAFMNSIEGGHVTPLHQGIFGKMDGAGYKQFFESRVRRIGYNACGGGNAVACVIPSLSSSSIWITNNYIKFSHPQISRLMVVYHETRHTEVKNGNWMHADCPIPFLDENGNEMKSIWTGARLAGEAACDSTPLGSYGSSTILLKNISLHCDNCNEKVKMDAGIYADDQLGRVTDPTAKADMKRDFTL
jgi:hypothetical protein